MTKTVLAIPIYFSPIILIGILLETFANDAYPPEADSLGGPFFSYIFFCLPLALHFLSKVQEGRLRRPEVFFWNSRNHVFSAVSLLFSIFPLSLFWFGFLTVSISSKSVGSIFASTLLLAVTLLVRTFSIQPKIPAEQVAAPDG